MVGRYVPGTVAFATVSFDEKEGAKQRPVVLIGEPSYWQWDSSALVCPLTSVGPRPGDIEIDWQEVGLLRRSYARPRPRTIAKSRIHWELGTLDLRDLAALHQALRETLGLGGGAGERPA